MATWWTGHLVCDLIAFPLLSVQSPHHLYALLPLSRRLRCRLRDISSASHSHRTIISISATIPIILLYTFIYSIASTYSSRPVTLPCAVHHKIRPLARIARCLLILGLSIYHNPTTPAIASLPTCLYNHTIKRHDPKASSASLLHPFVHLLIQAPFSSLLFRRSLVSMYTSAVPFSTFPSFYPGHK